jgi:hypothetical protein
MCLHNSRTVVAGSRLSIWQCDICGAPLWWMDVSEDVVPVALDVDAMRMWEQRADNAVIRQELHNAVTRAMNPMAWREELRRAVNVSSPIALLYEERQRLIEQAEARLRVIRQANGEIDW